MLPSYKYECTALHGPWTWVMTDVPFQLKERIIKLSGNAGAHKQCDREDKCMAILWMTKTDNYIFTWKTSCSVGGGSTRQFYIRASCSFMQDICATTILVDDLSCGVKSIMRRNVKMELWWTKCTVTNWWRQFVMYSVPPKSKKKQVKRGIYIYYYFDHF